MPIGPWTHPAYILQKLQEFVLKSYHRVRFCVKAHISTYTVLQIYFIPLPPPSLPPHTYCGSNLYTYSACTTVVARRIEGLTVQAQVLHSYIYVLYK